MSLRVTDLAEIDKDYVPGLMCIRDMEREAFEAMEMPFSTPSASGQEVQLHNKIQRITLDNRQEYVQLALHYRLHEFDLQVILYLFNCVTLLFAILPCIFVLRAINSNMSMKY